MLVLEDASAELCSLFSVGQSFLMVVGSGLWLFADHLEHQVLLELFPGWFGSAIGERGRQGSHVGIHLDGD